MARLGLGATDGAAEGATLGGSAAGSGLQDSSAAASTTPALGRRTVPPSAVRLQKWRDGPELLRPAPTQQNDLFTRLLAEVNAAVVEEGVGAVAVPMAATMDDLETWWAEVYERARPTLLRALAASVGSFEGVEDAVQDAVADAISQQRTDVRSPEGWLYAAALNKLRNRRRRAAIFARLRLERSTPADELDDALLRLDVSRRLLALPQRDRELLVAKYYVGLTQEEIAQLLRMPRGTVASSIARAAAKYRAMEPRG